MKQWHHQEQRVVNDEALTILVAGFAQVSLFQSNQHMTVEAVREQRWSLRESISGELAFSTSVRHEQAKNEHPIQG